MRPQASASTANGHSNGTNALDSVADAAAALVAAAEPAELARTLARRLARVASAGRTTVWLVDSASPDHLRLAAEWPPTEADSLASPGRCALPGAQLARQVLDQGRAMLAPAGGGAVELAFRGRPDAPLWLVPLVAGGDRLGVAYLATERAPLNAEHVGRLLTLLGIQAALALRALNARTAAQVEGARFLAIAAHDLKNTATSIKGYTQLLRRYLPADSAPRAERYSAVVEQQVGVLCDALVALVDFGRIQSGRLVLEPEPADLRDVLADAQGRLAPADEVCELALTVPGEPVLGAWDRLRLERAFVAILDNARRAPTEQCAVPVALTTDAGRVELRVGAPPVGETWPRPGEWAASADMALCLARGLIKAHGGDLAYRRTNAGEPLLHLTLPLAPPAD
jgi:signal transduction histidine kinase